jgi:CRISPR-associated protein Csm1
MTQEEKTLILGALFHDIGKFVQRCTDKSQSHPTKGVDLVDEFANEFITILGSEDNFNHFKKIIATHHHPSDELSNYCKIADHISASERVEKEENEEGGTDWNNNFLCSLFTKIRLNSVEEIKPRYFKHIQLTKENYNALIPEFEQNDDDAFKYKYRESDLNEFKTQLKIILSFYKDDSDFNTLINLLLILFEKWLWCVPDFTGSSQTDISLFNHLKDVAGFSHAIQKTQKVKKGDQTLNLVIGDIPGIQSYIFDVIHKKPAKILRGRSIFVQVLARNFASKFLDNFGLTECNLVMLAGGKFYIIAPNHNEFETQYKKSIKEIEDYLADTFNYEMGFVAGYKNFNWEKLKDKEITFGEIIEEATENLNKNKTHKFSTKLFKNGSINYSNFILDLDFIEPKDGDSNNIKCKVTDKPIRKNKEGKIFDEEESLQVLKQVEVEYSIGDEVTDSNLVLVLDKNNLDINKVYPLNKVPSGIKERKILINPTLDKLLEESKNKNLLRNTLLLEVANYCSVYQDENGNKTIMPFDKMVEQNDGAKYLTLIKGDIDNLGLIMAYGLARDKNEKKYDEEQKDLTAVSRTTTLSNHLKYFFSFFLNGFLRQWEVNKQIKLIEEAKKLNPEINDEELQKIKNEDRVYTVFAGGDDLMLICPQSSSLALLKEFNDIFTEFVCNNNEVHISYSLTNFKDHTPIRIVAEMAEENQKQSKKNFKKKFTSEFLKDAECFYSKNDKAGTYLFETAVKNSRLKDIEIQRDMLVKWVKDNNNPVTMGTIRNLLQISELIKDYEKGDTSKLIWHPMLTYSINRNISGKKGETEEVKDFFQKVLSIYKDDEGKKIQEILYPVLCETIYKLRK